MALATLLPAQMADLGAPLITNYDSEQYKAHNQNWVAVQDGRGVMYFGNTFGILEFDGLRWQYIPTPGKSVTRGLIAGPDGTIFYGSVGDLGYLAVSASGQVSAVSLLEALPAAERSFNVIWQVESAADGIYFLTRSRIFRFHDGLITVLPGKFAQGQACVLNGTLFYADIDQGICLVNGDRVLPIPQLAGVYNGKRITLAPLGSHEILAGRSTGDFLRLDLTVLWDETSKRFDLSRPTREKIVHVFPTELDELLKDSQAFLYKLLPLGPKAYAIATYKAGIIIFDRAGKIVRAINKEVGLSDNTVFGLWADRSSNLWAMNNVGISHIALSVPQSNLAAANGIEGVPMSAYFYQGRLYVGTYQNLFVQLPYHYTFKNNLPKYLPIKEGPREIWQLLEVGGDLMVASGRGLFRVQDDTAYRVPGSADATCLSLSTSKKWPDHLFVGLMGGLEVFKRSLGQWVLVGKVGEINDAIRRIAEDSFGDLWLSTEVNGLLRVHFSGSNPTQVLTHSFGPEQGLPGLKSLRAVIHEKTLYALTLKGLFRTDIQPWTEQETNQPLFVPDTTLGKIFNDPPKALNVMVSDGRGGFIFSTSERVVWAVLGKDGQFQVSNGPFQGLPSVDWTIYTDPQGAVWVPGKTLFRVEPWAKKNYGQGFEVLIRKVVSKTQRVLFAGTFGTKGTAIRSQRTVFQRAQENEEIPQLPYEQNGLFFEFSGTFYENPRTIQFQYLLEGFDKDWSDWSLDTRKEYTNLSEGHYLFLVRAKNLYGTLGQEARYAFRILAPWYRTIWAVLIWIMAGILFLVWIFTLYTHKLRRQKKRLERLVIQRTQDFNDQSLKISESNKELEAANFRLQEMDKLKKNLTAMLVHDLSSPLSAISMALQIYEKKGKLEKPQIDSMRHSVDNMIIMTNDLMEVFRGEVADMYLELAPLPIHKVICEVQASYKDQAARAGIGLVIDVPDDLPFIHGDRVKVERVLANLMNNALKYTPKDGTISISARVLRGAGVEEGLQFVTVQVKDSGQGIPPEDLPFIFDPYRQVARKGAGLGVGLGLAIVHRIMAAHLGRVTVRSQAGVGTAFMLYFPLFPGRGVVEGLV